MGECERRSDDYDYKLCYLIVYVEPTLCTVGFLLNIACIVAFLSVSTHGYFRKTSLVLYLIALTACNALQLLFSIFVIILPAMLQYISLEDSIASDISWLNLYSVRLGYPLMMMANYAAIWMLVLICAQRYQAICHPSNPWKKRLNCVRRSKAAVIIVSIGAILLNMVRFFELEWVQTEYPITAVIPTESPNMVVDDTQVEWTVAMTSLKHSILYKIIQEGILYGLLIYTFPVAILVWLNVNIAALIRHKQIHVNAASRRPAEYRTAIMTVFVVVLFFLCTTLSTSIRLLTIFTDNTTETLLWLVDVSNLLMNANALLTPFLFFIFTRGFKDLFFVIRFAPHKHAAHLSVMEKSPLTAHDDLSPIAGL